MGRGMRLTEPVEDLLAAMEAGGLPSLAGELREYLEEGMPLDTPPFERILTEEEPEIRYRERSPREQVLDACAFIAEQLIEPYFMIEDAQGIATWMNDPNQLLETKGIARSIMLVDPNFEDRPPAPAITEEELGAAREVAAWLPKARAMMMRRLGEDDVSPDDPDYDPLDPDRGAYEMVDDKPQRPIEDRPMRHPLEGVKSYKKADFARKEWPASDSGQLKRELGMARRNLYGV